MSSAIIFYTIAGFGIIKGLRYSRNILASIRFLRKEGEQEPQRVSVDPQKLPEIIIALPVLREQQVLSQTLDWFKKFDYPRNKFKVLIVTTQKELLERREGLKKLSLLAQDIKNGLTHEKILEKHLGLFPKEALKKIIKKGQKISRQKELVDFLEQKYNQFPTTIDLAKQLVPRLNKKLGWQCFYHLHYPKTFGVMSHQLNFAARNLTKILGGKINPDRVYFGVYNADSAPNLKTLLFLGIDAGQYYQKDGHYPEVYQQIAAYVKNFGAYPKTPKGWFLKASSIVQTRWALGSEIPMLRRHSAFWEQNKNKKLNLVDKLKQPSAYCVGHGLFIRCDVLKKIGYFPDETLNEDLALGYYLCLNHIPIRTIPALENVENPETITGLVKQKAMWFWGMIDYFEYRQIAKNKVKSADPIEIDLLALHGFVRDTLPWLFCSPLLALLIVLPIALGSCKLFSVVLLSLVIYAVLPSLLIIIHLPELFKFSSDRLPSIRAKEVLKTSLFSLPYLLISSIGPWITFWQKLVWKTVGKKPKKNKTER